MDVIKQYFKESKESVCALIPTEVFEFDQADNDGKLKNYRIPHSSLRLLLLISSRTLRNIYPTLQVTWKTNGA